MAAGEDPSSPTACPGFFVEALTAPKLGQVLRQLLGEGVEFLSTKPVLKTGKIRHASPWHQDFPCTLPPGPSRAPSPSAIDAGRLT